MTTSNRIVTSTLWAVLTAAMFTVLSSTSSAQTAWPGKIITYVVPYPAGGTTDILGRTVAQKLSAALGTTIVVDNKAGATGAIGSTFVARAAPDGNTILGTSIGPMAIVPSLKPDLSYDPVKSFEPVAIVGTIPHVLIVNGSSPYKSVADVIAAAKAKPGTLTFGSGGNGTILQMQGELLKLEAGIDMIHVPYKGDTPAIQDVIGNQITMMFVPVAPALPHIQAGRLRAIAVTSARRLKSLPSVPTMEEAKLPNFVVEQWQAVYVPAGTSKAIVTRLNEEIVRALKDPEVVDRLEKLGVNIVGSTPGQLAAIQRNDTAKWARVIKSAGVKLDE
jgi:tripartite-type tricarboxylate transporter receptor subunit TctC